MGSFAPGSRSSGSRLANKHPEGEPAQRVCLVPLIDIGSAVVDRFSRARSGYSQIESPAAGRRGEHASGLNCYAWNLSISGSLLRAKAMRSTGCHTGVNILPLVARNKSTLSTR